MKRISINKTTTRMMIAVVVAASLAASPAWAGGGRSGRTRTGRTNTSGASGTSGTSSTSGTTGTTGTTPKPPATQPAPATPTTPKATPSTAVAQAELDNANQALNALVKQLTDAFEQTPDFLAAKKAAVDAADAYETAKAAVLAALPGKDPTYKAAKAQEAAGARKIAALKDAEASPDDLAAATQALADIQTTIAVMENKAADSDPSMAAPKAKLNDALAKVHGMQSDYANAMKLTPDYIAAKKAVDDAQAKLASLK